MGSNENPIRHIEYIAQQASGSKLSDELLSLVRPSCQALSYYLDCNHIQGVLFSVLFNINLSHRSVGIDRIADWFKCATITLALHIDQLEDLRRKKILRREIDDDYDNRLSRSISSINYSVNPDVYEALQKNEKFKVPKMQIKDTYDLIKAISLFIQQRAEGEITFQEMWHEINMTLQENSGMDFLKELKRYPMDEKERILFLNLCDEYYNGSDTSDLVSMVRLVTPSKREQMSMRQLISSGNSRLVKRGLVEVGEGSFRSDKDIYLSNKAIDMLLKDNRKMIINKKEIKVPDIILAGDINEKKLFLAHEVQEEIKFLTQLLMPDSYKKLIKRLKKSGMKTGISILYHGPSGTGKTESVYQLAKATGRNILQVTISDLTSKWFGESQKLVHSLFQKYQMLVEKSDIAPILFFNEADGIFGSRKKAGNSSVDQTENAIQNLLLEGLENLEGIMIATTNLMQNFDKAFDRRFLYKIYFGKPTVEARYHIWKDKIPMLKDCVASSLAEKYDISGGQIDNVSRKYILSQVLHGKTPTLFQIEVWCVEESACHELKTIGYKIG